MAKAAASANSLKPSAPVSHEIPLFLSSTSRDFYASLAANSDLDEQAQNLLERAEELGQATPSPSADALGF